MLEKGATEHDMCVAAMTIGRELQVADLYSCVGVSEQSTFINATLFGPLSANFPSMFPSSCRRDPHRRYVCQLLLNRKLSFMRGIRPMLGPTLYTS